MSSGLRARSTGIRRTRSSCLAPLPLAPANSVWLVPQPQYRLFPPVCLVMSGFLELASAHKHANTLGRTLWQIQRIHALGVRNER